MQPETLCALLAERVRKTPDAVAFREMTGAVSGTPVTWGEFARAADAVAVALSRSGLARGERIGIVAPSSVEWEYVQMGALRLGAVVVGIDPNYADDTLRAAISASKLSALAVGDRATLERIPSDLLHSLRCVLTIGTKARVRDRALHIDDVLAETPSSPSLRDPVAGDMAIVVFSSGTTGVPKPIAYTHAQVVMAVRTIIDAFPAIDEGSASLVCWLPLANLFQRVINFCAIAKGATSHVVGDPRNVMQALPAAAPDLLIGVPRFYERVQRGMIEHIGSTTGVRRAFGTWAMGVADRRATATPSLSDRVLAPLADLLVFKRLRGVFGTRVRYLISGSAPMPDRLLRWYEAIGLAIYEAYGVSENIVPVAMNTQHDRRSGSVGKPLKLNHVRIADDGEILVGGDGLFSGYLDAGAEERPRRTGEASWPTGDLGTIDTDGFLWVTGRKSEVFKTGGGRWVAPTRIEAALRAVVHVDQAMVVGAGRPALVALVTLDVPAIRASFEADGNVSSDLEQHHDVASRIGLVRETLREAIAQLPTQDQPKVVLVSMQPFTIGGGELTSNLKLRRKAVERKFEAEIDDAYARMAASTTGLSSGPATPIVDLIR